MSYQVLARKYRPHSFEELVGQEHVVQALANALTQQRLHHAYLFTGTRGVGKTTVSRILAKSLNCTGPDGQGGITAKPCGVCDACRDIDAGRFVDYVELDAASNRGVEEISQLLDQAVYKPVMGRFKVYMIDEVHMLSNTAFNAMLKTLEEPPDYLKFVLATTDPQKVPVTVLSRCLQFNLRPMAPQTVLSHLTQVLQAENVAADAGSLRLLSRAARGSMRDALSLTDQAIAFGAGALAEDGVRQMLGTVDRGHVVAILDALIAASGVAVVAQADTLRGLGLSAAGTLEDLAGLLQQMAVAQAAPAALDETDPDTAEAQRLSALLPADEIQLMYSMALHGRQELALAPDEYAGLLMVLLRMLSFRPQGAGRADGVAPAPAALARASRGPQAGAQPAALPQRSPAVAQQHVAALPQQNHAASQAARPAVTVQAAAPAAALEEAPPEEPPAAPQASPEPAAERAPALAPIVAPAEQPVPAAAYTAPVPVEPPVVAEPAQPPMPATTAAPSLEAGASPSAGLHRPLVENGGGHSARLRPRAVVHKAEPEPEEGAGHGSSDQGEPPPWLDAPMGDEEGAAFAGAFAGSQSADDAFDEGQGAGSEVGQTAERAPRNAAERRAYQSTAGDDVPLQPTPLGELWAEQIRPMGLAALTRELAVRSQCVGREDDGDTVIWRLRVERESLRQNVLKDKLQAALEVAMQRKVLIELEAGVAHDSPALRDAAVTQARQREVEQIVIRDPLAQALMAQFKTARIVPGSIKSH